MGRVDAVRIEGWRMGTMVAGVLLAALALPQPAAAQGVIEVPLNEHEGRLWVPVQGADGSEFRFILGTGSPGTLYSASGAARQARTGDLFMGGRADAPVNMDGTQTLPDSLFFYRGEQFDGQLAPNTLNAYDMLLDGPGGKLLLQPIGRPPTWDGYELSEPVRLRVYHGTVLTLPVDFGGTTVQAMLELSAPQVIGNPAVGASGLIAEDGAMAMSIGETGWPDLPGLVEDSPILRRFSAPEDPFALVGGVIAVDCPIAISYVRAELRTCVR
jgi:hypothetical protein